MSTVILVLVIIIVIDLIRNSDRIYNNANLKFLHPYQEIAPDQGGTTIDLIFVIFKILIETTQDTQDLMTAGIEDFSNHHIRPLTSHHIENDFKI